MSSYYTAAQLEAMRKEKLKKDLEQSVNMLRDQMRIERANNVTAFRSQNIETFVADTDEGSSGYTFSGKIASGAVMGDSHAGKTEENDLSSLLSFSKKPSKLEAELNGWVKKLSDRAVLSETDARDYTRILGEISKIINSSAMDIEDKVREVGMRVKSYLQGGTLLEDVDRAALEDEYFEYCALCEMLDADPVETLPYKVKSEIKRLRTALEKKMQDGYIMETIEEIMGKLGCRVKEDAILDHTEGLLFSVDGHPTCDVFVGADGCGIMFEPIAESRSGSLEKRRQIEHSASSICSLYSEIEEMAAEKGVILKRVYADPASVDTICVSSDIQHSANKKHQRKAHTVKLKAKEME